LTLTSFSEARIAAAAAASTTSLAECSPRTGAKSSTSSAGAPSSPSSDNQVELRRQPRLTPRYARRQARSGASSPRPTTSGHETAGRESRAVRRDAGLASGAPGQGLLGERWPGRPSLRRGRARHNPFGRLRLARLGREPGSVLVVCAPGLPCRVGSSERRARCVHRVGRASRPLRDRDQRTGKGALRGSRSQHPGRAAGAGEQSRSRRCDARSHAIE
jgi:hypothetical protein